MEENEYINLFRIRPCREARAWLETQADMKSAWANCPRGDWLWWALRNAHGSPEINISVAFARDCSERAKKYVVKFPLFLAADNDTAADGAAIAADGAAVAADDAAAAADSAAYTASDTAAYAAYAEERKCQADWIRANVQYPWAVSIPRLG